MNPVNLVRPTAARYLGRGRTCRRSPLAAAPSIMPPRGRGLVGERGSAGSGRRSLADDPCILEAMPAIVASVAAALAGASAEGESRRRHRKQSDC